MNDDEIVETIPLERLAALGRAAHESSRFASPDRERLEQGLHKALGTLTDSRARTAALKEIEPLLGGRRSAAASGGGMPPVLSSEDRGPVGELQRNKASLENRLAGEVEKLQAAERALKKEQDDHQHAVETLKLQQKQIRELGEQRDRLLSERDQLDSKLRLQVNETEQIQNDLKNLRDKRQQVSDQTTTQQERINDLERQLERLRDELERARQERDSISSQARTQVAAVESQSADAVFGELWAQMRKTLPDVFAETHVPNRKTFERVCEAFTYALCVYFGLESNTKERLKEVRNANDATDMCNMLYGQLERTPALAVRLREMLASDRNDGSFRKRMAVVYAATCALPVGLRNVILRSGEVVQGKLQVAKWGLAPNSRDAVIGEHYRTKVERTAPDDILAELRKSTGKEVFAKYEEEMRKQLA